MLRSRAARELSRCTGSALLISRRASRPPIEDRPAALYSAALGRRGSGAGRRHRRSLVDGTRPRLRHDHSSRRWSRRWSRGRLWLWNLGCRWVRLHGGRADGFDWRRLLGACRNFSWRSNWRLRSRGCRRDNRRRDLGLLCGWCRRRGLGRSRFHNHWRLLGRFLLRDAGVSRRWLDDHWRNYGDGGTCCRCACGGLRDHGARRGLRRDRRLRRRNDGRCGARLRHDPARLRLCGNSRRCRHRNDGRCGLYGWLGNGCGSLAWRYLAPACLGFLFLFLGQNGLHHVSRLGDVGKINLRSKCLGSARRRAATRVTCMRPALEVLANLIRFVLFDRTRVGFALAHPELPEHIEDLSTFDFQLAREIVNSNLAHPPLFRMCCPSPLVAHSYLLALAD